MTEDWGSKVEQWWKTHLNQALQFYTKQRIDARLKSIKYMQGRIFLFVAGRNFISFGLSASEEGCTPLRSSLGLVVL